MTKRLCDLFQLESNTKDCAVFTIKQETSPLDLIKLGGFEGHECMVRMAKDPRTACITVFRDGDEPYHMSYGSSTTLVGEARRKVRDLVMEMVNLDYGIVTGGRTVRSGNDFDRLVEKTSGARDLDSLREFELIRTPAGDGSLFVNGQHVAHIRDCDMDQWLAERSIAMLRGSYEQPTGNGCTVIKGEFQRMESDRVVYPETLYRESLEDFTSAAPASPQMDAQAFSNMIDKAVDSFLSKTGWRGLSPSNIVREFARFAKQDMEPSLDDAVGKAKEKAAERNAARPEATRGSKPRDMER